MKPGKPLQRRTPLAGNPDTHREWVRRSQDTARAKAQQTPQRPSAQPGESRARRLVRKRSGGLCEIRLDGRCTWWATEWSHRIRHSQGGPWTPSNGLAACHWCHLAITNTNGHRAEYRALGLVLDRDDNPAAEPAVCIHGPVLLDDEGGWQLIDNHGPKGEAA